MRPYFGLKMLRDFRLPCAEIRVADGRGAIDANAQSQGSLVLMRKRNQISIAQHERFVLRNLRLPVWTSAILPPSPLVRRRAARSASRCEHAAIPGSAFHSPRRSYECG